MLYLVRHCEPDNPDRRFNGRGNPPLSEAGLRHADALGEAMSKLGIGRIVASPLTRTRQTAAPLSAAIDIEVEIEDRLVECDFGDWEGLTWDEIEAKHPDEAAAYLKAPAMFAFPGGESPAAVAARAVPAVRELLPPEGAQPTAIFSHNGPIRLAVNQIMGCPMESFLSLRIDLGSVSTCIGAGDRVVVNGINIDPTAAEVVRWEL